MTKEHISYENLSEYDGYLRDDANILKRNTNYVEGNIVNKGQVFLKCTQSGKTKATTLSISGVSVGDILADGTAEWEVVSINGIPQDGGGSGLEDWKPNHSYKEDDIFVSEHQIYKALVGFTSGSTFEEIEILEDYTLSGETPIPWAEGTEINTNDIVEYNSNYYKALYDFTCGEEFTKVAFEEYVPKSLTDSQINDIVDSFNPEFIGTPYTNGVPIGTIINFMGTRAPSDYLICDGTVYNIIDYENLAEFFNDQFGSYNFFGGDGTTTFAVPDLRGEFLRGTGTNSHTNQGNGASVGIHQDGTEIPYFYYDGSGKTFALLNRRNSATTTYNNIDGEILGDGVLPYVNQSSQTSAAGLSCCITSRPTNTSVLYCIKYR